MLIELITNTIILYTYRLLCSLICKRLVLVVTCLRPLYFCLVCYCLVHYCRVYSLLSRCPTECCPRHSLRPTRYVTTLDCCSCKRAAHGFDSCGCFGANHDKIRPEYNQKNQNTTKIQDALFGAYISTLYNNLSLFVCLLQASCQC